MNIDTDIAFSQFVKALHDETGVDPQYAEILPDNHVVYAFIQVGFRDPLTGHVWYIADENRHSKLSRAYSNLLNIHLERHGGSARVEEVDKFTRTIVLTYKPKSKNGLLGIRRLLETIPIENGQLPQKDATFFCYD